MQPQYIDMRGFLSFLILHELKKRGMCGDELAFCIGQKKGAKLTPGTIYPTLKNLRKRGFISFKKRGRKKIYFLTETGNIEYKLGRKAFKKMFSDIL